MKGADLRCSRCGSGSVDVAPGYDLDPSPPFPDGRSWAIAWTCAAGHQQISGIRDPAKGLEWMTFGTRWKDPPRGPEYV